MPGRGKGGPRGYRIDWIELFDLELDQPPTTSVLETGDTLAGAVSSGEAGKVLKVLDRCAWLLS
jgi:hypothetical protein